MTTSLLISTSLLAFSRTMLVTWAFRVGGSSKVEATTSPETLLLKSVTSSGLSAMRRTMRYISGWFFSMELAMVLRRVVLPARGGETIRPRCPLPMGVRSSMILAHMFLGLPSWSLISSKGYRGVRPSNLTFRRISMMTSGWRKLTASILMRAKYFSPFFGARTIPEIVSPVRSWNLRIWDGET